MLLKCQRKFGAVGFLHRYVVFNTQRVQRLAAKVFTHHAGTNALARSVHRSSSTSRATAHHQHVESVFGIDFFGFAFNAFGVDFREYFFQAQAALSKFSAVQKNRWHRHDLPFLDFILE